MREARCALWLTLFLAGCAAPPAAPPQPIAASPPAAHQQQLPLGCRHAEELRCSGVAPRDDEPDSTTVVVCDECQLDGDCTGGAQGRCVSVGGQRCAGPARRVCRYGAPCVRTGAEPCPDDAPPPIPPTRGN